MKKGESVAEGAELALPVKQPSYRLTHLWRKITAFLLLLLLKA